MMERDDFENRLGQGLKRWAESGRPSLDLEAFVKLQTDASPAAEQTEGPGNTSPEQVSPEYSSAAVAPQTPSRLVSLRQKAARPLVRWIGSVAAVAVLMLVAGFTLPNWVGTAAGWPVIGPALTEIIMKDAGLKWAYDQNLIQGTVAEVQQGEITVRILGTVADQVRTTVIYQIIGWEEPVRQGDDKPIRADGGTGLLSFARPVNNPPRVSIAKVSGVGVGSWSSQAVATPLGLVGIASALPLSDDQAVLEVAVLIGAERMTLEFPVVRTGSEFTREVTIDQSQTIEGITITVDSVVYMPAETMITYRVNKTPVKVGWGFGGEKDWSQRVETGDQRLSSIHISGTWETQNELTTRAIYPAFSGPARLVIPMEVKSQQADLVWPLQTGATQEIVGTQIALTGWEREGDRIAFSWAHRPTDRLVGFGDFEVLDADGNRYPLDLKSEGYGSSPDQEYRTLETTLPSAVTPVAVRAATVAVVVEGPWTFELP